MNPYNQDVMNINRKRLVDIIASRLCCLGDKSKLEVQAITHAQLTHLQCLGLINKWMFQMKDDRIIVRFTLDFSDLGTVMEVPLA